MAITPIPNILNNNLLQGQLNANFSSIIASLAVLNGFSGAVSTTTATVTTAATIATTTGATVQLELMVQGRRTGGSSGTAGDGAAYQIAVGAKNVAGTVTIISQAALFTAESQAGWDCTVTASGANLLVRVTGAANNNINWSVAGRKYEVV